jgi:hypothetical protein
MVELEMLHIWGNSIVGEVIHPFVKTCMKCGFYMFGNNVVPENVFGGEHNETKEDAFSSMVAKLALHLPGGQTQQTWQPKV